MSKQGWIDSGLFYLWFPELFLKSIPPTRPVLLLLDGTLREAQKEGVIILCLPPNTTHAAQPLNFFFGPLKKTPIFSVPFICKQKSWKSCHEVHVLWTFL